MAGESFGVLSYVVTGLFWLVLTSSFFKFYVANIDSDCD